ncbi:unnamed protein product [Arabidopsis halleri]
MAAPPSILLHSPRHTAPKQIHEIKDLLLTARRRDARSVTMKRSKDFIRCVFDQAKADKLAISSFR